MLLTDCGCCVERNQLATPAALRALPDARRRKSVVVVQDAFTTHYDTTVVLDWFELLQRLGFEPWLAPYCPNGKPQHVLGMLEKFRTTASHNALMLSDIAKAGVRLVGLDPSMTLAYRAEYLKALGEESVPRIALPQEWLAEHLEELPQFSAEEGPAWLLLPHCTERTNAPEATADWARVGRRLGVDMQIVAIGCCGMAGLYGHEIANRKTSEVIYGLSWGPILKDAKLAGRMLATGYSCRCQAGLIDGLRLMHPLQLLLRAVKARPVEFSTRDMGFLAMVKEHHEEF